jgi:hypothetical protein
VGLDFKPNRVVELLGDRLESAGVLPYFLPSRATHREHTFCAFIVGRTPLGGLKGDMRGRVFPGHLATTPKQGRPDVAQA